eukprot:CAMPEP_0194043998 /NCGR_PEP_ID=MMETSP0009_2-20130614/15551_1 /TAXON_ID=210454 /ORGANISM="Grammatophora oceanica, Strain CCMP 410" /LENGTH=165 /DNA_ID=CAMNT_0038688405 /DNA_START=156 /DNA_END=653 /DNA_ORIENTATION=+
MDDVQSASSALQQENAFPFFGRDLKVSYAKETSDRIAKRNGTYVPKARRKKAKPPPAAVDASTSETDVGAGSTAAPPMAEAPKKSDKDAPPSHILFATDLPADVNQMMLEMLFRNYKGLKEVRIPRPGLAFVEFDDTPHATLALQALDGFNITNSVQLNLKYAKA